MRGTRPSGDVEEVLTYCPDCQEERAFRLEELEIPGYDASNLDDVLADAVAGEPLYRCPACGRIEPDLVVRRAYDYELRDTGYEVGQWQDEEVTTDEEGGSPIPEEWHEEEAMEPRGRGPKAPWTRDRVER